MPASHDDTESRSGMQRARRKVHTALRGVVYAILLGLPLALLTGELVLRLAGGRPTGLFEFVRRGKNGSYPPNSVLRVGIGPVPYTITTNSLGLRGPEILATKRAGTIRVAALGDSVTNGFYVADDETYPHFLEAALRREGMKVEVLNVARGGASIGEEFAQLREIALPLDPDVAVLTFVSNDIAALRGKSIESLVTMSLAPTPSEEIVTWFITRSALGEWVAERLLPTRAVTPGESGDGLTPADFQKNVDLFIHRYRATDGLVLTGSPSESTRRLLELYRKVLEKMANAAREKGVFFVVVYAPSYSQLYDPSSSLFINAWLQNVCAELDIAFIDPTVRLREAARNRVLHFAPQDFHFNAEGNRAFAEAVADALNPLVSRSPTR